MHQLDLQHELNRQLSSAQTWDELAASLVQFPQVVVPAVGTTLLVYDQAKSTFEQTAEWWDPKVDTASRSAIFVSAPDFCRACSAAQSSSIRSLVPCYSWDKPGGSELPNGYCLPLVHGDQITALLHLYLPPTVPLTPSQTEILNSFGPAMALAIDGALPQRSEMIRAAATEAERRRIARDLHDTLGQQIGYLHLKLDQLTGEDALGEIAAVRRELERARDVANEAYEQVRGMLVTLRPGKSVDLAAALLDLANSAGNRAGFQVQLVSHGQSRALLPSTQGYLVYIFREALNNVEKHARAQKVNIELVWDEAALTVRLSDDGRGFDPGEIQADGHFGLKIMQERAGEINGQLKITSRPGSGTEVIFQLPLGLASSN
jgi:signal transduction histidine kinase